MRILMLGLLYDREQEAALLHDSKVGLQAQANRFQWDLIAGLSANLAEEIRVIASYPTGAYPRYSRKARYPARTYRPNDALTVKYIPTLNIPVVREILRARRMRAEVESNMDPDGPNVLIVYSLQLAFTMAVSALRRGSHSDLTVVVVVPDLYGRFAPGIGPMSLRGIWDRLILRARMRLAAAADAFVLLTEEMAGPVQVRDRPHVVVEGFYPGDAENPEAAPPPRSTSARSVCYTGTLHEEFGVRELIDSFLSLSLPDCELWLAGSGPLTDYVRREALRHERVRFFGFLDSAGVRALQRGSTILINPRPPTGEFTRFSFPSKTLEYLSSGRPVLTYKLPGIPDDYDPYLMYVDSPVGSSLRDALRSACELTSGDLDDFGSRARQWARIEKSPERQARPIADLIREFGREPA